MCMRGIYFSPFYYNILFNHFDVIAENTQHIQVEYICVYILCVCVFIIVNIYIYIYIHSYQMFKRRQHNKSKCKKSKVNKKGDDNYHLINLLIEI